MRRLFTMLVLCAGSITVAADPPATQPVPAPAANPGDGVKKVVVAHGDVVEEVVLVEMKTDPGVGFGDKQPFIGVVASPLTPSVRAQTDLGDGIGLAIESVAPDSPAAQAGLQQFDILARYEDQILCAPEQLTALVKRTGRGKTATLTVIRRGKEVPITVTVGESNQTAVTARMIMGPGLAVSVIDGKPTVIRLDVADPAGKCILTDAKSKPGNERAVQPPSRQR